MKIKFIINPISGAKRSTRLTNDLIKKTFSNSGFDISISETEYAGHAYELTKMAISERTEIVVAVGGDGTINEVGRALIHTDTALGILPSGSGNGFARHFSIPLRHEKAIQLFLKPTIHTVDTAVLNRKVYLGIAGVGFDAHIGQLFATHGTRGAWPYFKIAIKEFFHYKEKCYTIYVDGKVYQKDAFFVTVANTNQFGNNSYISPDSEADDAILDICIVKKMNLLKGLKFTYDLFTKNLKKNSNIIYLKGEKIQIIRNSSGPIHLDGEPEMDNKILDFSIVPQSLKLVIP